VDALTARRAAAAVLAAIAGVLALAGASPAVAHDQAAYARLLEAHVRRGTVSGIDLALVDYEAVRGDPDYPRALRDLAAARPEALAVRADRLAFWINAYNLLAIKAVLDQYPTRSIRDGGTLLRPIWKRKVGAAAGREYALDDIEHGILRPEFKDPRVHMAIVCASLSCPDLRREPFAGARLDAQLDDEARRFLANPTKGLAPSADGRSARVSSIFKWFREDFAPAGGVVAFIRAKAGPELAPRLAGLTDARLTYLDYDWSLNDSKRAR
jgi:hypothetical protein